MRPSHQGLDRGGWILFVFLSTNMSRAKGKKCSVQLLFLELSINLTNLTRNPLAPQKPASSKIRIRVYTHPVSRRNVSHPDFFWNVFHLPFFWFIYYILWRWLIVVFSFTRVCVLIVWRLQLEKKECRLVSSSLKKRRDCSVFESSCWTPIPILIFKAEAWKFKVIKKHCNPKSSASKR